MSEEKKEKNQDDLSQKADQKNIEKEEVRVKYEQLLRDRNRLVHLYRHRSESYEKFSRMAIWIVGITIPLMLWSVFLVVQENESYVSKAEIKNKIVAAIRHNADLRAIRNIYENRKISKKKLSQFFDDMEDYYYFNVPLSTIFEDIRTEVFLADSVDSLILKKLDRIIEEHLQVNPFDILESSQKDYFENIRIKLGEQYPQIRSEMDKLVNELYTKNSLVSEYLKDSTTSFWISVIALIFAICVGIFQIYQNRASRLKLFLASAIAESSSSDGEEHKADESK